MDVYNDVNNVRKYHNRWICRGKLIGTKLIDLMNIRQGDNVLDIASGTGIVTNILRKKVGGNGLVVCVDIAYAMIKESHRIHCEPNVLFMNADAENLAFGTRFDAITCQFGLFYFRIP